MRIAVVVPRYGERLAGGAEHQARGFAEAAARRGWKVQVWTTCASSHYTWENVHSAGADKINGVVVERFPITHWDHDRRAELESRLNLLGALSFVDQSAWLETGAHSALLYEHIAKHVRDFDALIALPYAMPLTHYAAWSAPDQTILWPCLHNEPYAFQSAVHLLMETVQGVMFNSPEERDLAIESLGVHPRRHAVVGEGVNWIEPVDGATPPPGDDLLYVGRLEHGKNVPLLYEYVRRYVEEGGKLRLAVLGDGPVKPPPHAAFDYRGFVSEKDKAQAYASALVLCQPSVNESFSLTMMEAWAQARPVLVNGNCAVTRGHVQRCNGGLWFHDYEEFAQALEWLKDHPALASRMGQHGREYVCRNYRWETIVDRFERLLNRWRTA
jgi:glycosyltransferase involved in cell wall biosynthesis